MGYKSRFVIITGILATILITGSVFAASDWGKYHYDDARLGVNDAESGLDGPNISLIWTFPRYDVLGDSADSKYIIDMPGAGSLPTGTWKTLGNMDPTNPPGNYYDSDFYWTEASSGDKTNPATATARWDFPSGTLPNGAYTIQVWFPSSGGGRTNTTTARYTVAYGAGKSSTFTIDQTVGGRWITLGSGPMEMTSGSYIELSNSTDDYDARKDAGEDTSTLIVCADAVRFVPSSGMKIYSSPAAAASLPIAIGGGSIPGVWIGTIESPIASLAPGVDDFGAVYCVRSYQGVGLSYTELQNSSSTLWTTNDDVKYVGTAAWRYPLAGVLDANDDGSLKSPNDRLDIEGPIGGISGTSGVYSSPTLVDVNGVKYIVFGGMDGQVYCVNAVNGKLAWKGPGVTIPEPVSMLPAGWQQVNGRYDAFGGNFALGPTTADTTQEKTLTWKISGTNSDPGDDASKENEGHKYAIYAWIPARNTTTETSKRSRDAAYEITYWDAANSKESTDWVRVDQRDPTESTTSGEYNCGTWVKIGGDYWNPRQVRLSNLSLAKDADRVVVADVIMVVPAEIGAFSYSSAVSDGTNVYIGNTNGRVYALKMNPGRDSGKLEWTFPKVQTSNPAEDPEDSIASPFGALVSSPALSSGNLVVSSMDGKVYDITSLNSNETGVTLKWAFNAKDLAGTTEAFSSSPAIYKGMVYAASIGGRLYKIDLNDGTCLWSCPNAADSTAPLSAFRFSTPAIYEGTSSSGTTETHIFCGSTGGQVYGFTDAGVLMDETNSNYTTPNVYAPIQGAIAIDSKNMYIGTVGTGDGDDGGMWWFDRDSGLASYDGGTTLWDYSGYSDLGMVFSSPAVANDYMYAGTGGGRLCAFSSTAFGGAWVGGGADQAGKPPLGDRQHAPNPAKASQVDVFSPAVYNETLKAFQALADDGDTRSDVIGTLLATKASDDADLFVESSFTGSLTSITDGHKRAFPYPASSTTSGDRQLYIEWGEDLYLIAWNLPSLLELSSSSTSTSGVGSPSQKSCVRFRFNNSGSGATSGGTMNAKTADYLFEYKTGDVVEGSGLPIYKSVALAKVELRGTGHNQPAPGTGWTVTVQVTKGTDSDPTGVVPLLTGTPGSWTVKNPTSWESQSLGVNNPIAIRDDGLQPRQNNTPVQGSSISLGWPATTNSDGTYRTNRNEVTAHFNGNSIIDSDDKSQVIMPHIYLGQAPHGANSRVAPLQVMDRSAMGLKTNGIIDKFRIQTTDLHWDENAQARNPLPWDLLPYITIQGQVTRQQTDYPDITKRSERFQKESGDPSIGNNTLLAAIPNSDTDNSYDNAKLQAETVSTWVEVPKYQPANTYGPGYFAEVIAYVDSNGNGTCDTGDSIIAEPTTYIEAHRYFTLSADVLPDYHVIIEKPLTIDIVGSDGSIAPHGLGLYLNSSSLADWWKQFTVRNLGNVNLSNINIAKLITNGTDTWPLNLYSETVNPFVPLLGTGVVDSGEYPFGIVSSFDGWDPQWGNISGEPFKTSGYGYTLSKARVGDADPTRLTIPDQRKCDAWPSTTSPAIAGKGGTSNTGIEPSVSVIVPLSQPTGTYTALVPVFADMDITNNVLNLGSEPFSDPTFRINVAVAEDRLTGGSTAGSATQIDPSQAPTTSLSSRFISGDTQPAAWRDPATGDVHMFWSSNRSTSIYTQVTANDPWYIRWASLKYNKGSYTEPGAYSWEAANKTVGSVRWWDTPLTMEPPSAAEVAAAAGAPTTPMAAATPDKLPGDGWPNADSTLLPDTVKFSAPFAAMNLDTISSTDPMRVWLFWQGQADKLDPTTKKITRENRIFYTPVAGGSQAGSGSIPVFTFIHDLGLTKMNPRAIVYNNGSNEIMWLTWHGGDYGRWSLYGNLNISPSSAPDEERWASDVRFATPSCLVSVADASPVHRVIGNNSDADSYIDMAYTGVSKYDQASDIILTRYQWSGSATSPTVTPLQLPRIFGEELSKEEKHNVYTSKHLSWVRPGTKGAIDNDVLSSATGDSLWNYPVIRVLLPNGYTADDGTVFNANTVVSGTDGSLSEWPGSILTPGTEITAGTAIVPEIDQSTGVYTYTLSGKAGSLLGQMLVDYSAGIVRFTNPLPPKVKVYAFYTPQSRRLTRGSEQDSAPYMFVEKTKMESGYTPGLGTPTSYTKTDPQPIDRLWLFWCKPGTQASTIYYKTYRITAVLKDQIEMNTNGTPKNQVTVSGALNPYDISWDGKKIYFTGIDERYPGLPNTQGNLTITYTPKGSNTSVTETIDTLTWQEELPETALPTRLGINEGQICAFSDPCVQPTKIWVFWSSTRAGESDLYYQTISPNFRMITQK